MAEDLLKLETPKMPKDNPWEADREMPSSSEFASGLQQGMSGNDIGIEQAISQAKFFASRPRTPATGFYRDGTMSPYARRQLRMQEEWDKRYEMMIEEQKLARQMDLENRRFAIEDREIGLREQQEARLQAAEAKRQEEDFKISEQADSALNEVLGGFDPNGNPISGLDPDAPDYMQRRNDIIKRYPKALKDDAFKTAIATTDKSYFDTVNFNQQLQVQEESAGRIAERQEAAATRGEKERAAIREEDRIKQEERDIKKQESDIDKLIRSERQKIAEFQGQPESPLKKKSLIQSQNKILDLRIERADLRGLYFEDQEALNAVMKDPKTKLPAGTEVYIGRQKNIIR